MGLEGHLVSFQDVSGHQYQGTGKDWHFRVICVDMPLIVGIITRDICAATQDSCLSVDYVGTNTTPNTC